MARERTPTAVIAMPAHASLLRRVLPAKQGEKQFVCGDRSSLSPSNTPQHHTGSVPRAADHSSGTRRTGPRRLTTAGFTAAIPLSTTETQHSGTPQCSGVYLGSVQPKIHSDITSLASRWPWASWYAQRGVWVKTVTDQNTAVEVHLGQRMRGMRGLFILKQ